MTNFFTNRTLNDFQDGPGPGLVRWDDVLPLNEQVSRERAIEAVMQKLHLQGDSAAAMATIYTLVASGTLKARGNGVNVRYRLVRRWGPSGSAANEARKTEGPRDTALERVQERERVREENRIRRIVDERLRELGLVKS
jgi:transposase